jgi:hypothetical protein
MIGMVDLFTQEGVKRPGHETDHSPPSGAEVKNGGAIPPLTHMSSYHDALLIKHRDSFTFFLITFHHIIQISVCRYLENRALRWCSYTEQMKEKRLPKMCCTVRYKKKKGQVEEVQGEMYVSGKHIVSPLLVMGMREEITMEREDSKTVKG